MPRSGVGVGDGENGVSARGVSGAKRVLEAGRRTFNTHRRAVPDEARRNLHSERETCARHPRHKDGHVSSDMIPREEDGRTILPIPRLPPVTSTTLPRTSKRLLTSRLGMFHNVQSWGKEGSGNAVHRCEVVALQTVWCTIAVPRRRPWAAFPNGYAHRPGRLPVPGRKLSLSSSLPPGFISFL